MKTKISKRAWSLFLALALVVTTVFGSVTTAKAATTQPTGLVLESGTAEAGVETDQYPFTVDKKGTIDVGVMVPTAMGVVINLYKADTLFDSVTIYSNDQYWNYVASYEAFDNGQVWDLASGDYSVSYVFESPTQYITYVNAYVAEPKISETKATITAGYTKKLSVSDGTVKSWASSKKAVATVDKKGKITAKKAGKAVITATLTDGTKLKCTVTVKANKYTASKLTTSDVTYGNGAMSAYSAAFDKSGNLVVKVIFVNNTSYKATKLKGIKITVKNGAGATVGTYKLSSKNVSVPAHSTKSFSFTIKKSSLKKKTADLRNSTITCDGTYYYVY